MRLQIFECREVLGASKPDVRALFTGKCGPRTDAQAASCFNTGMMGLERSFIICYLAMLGLE